MKTILIPLDGTEHAEQALPYAVLFGKLLDVPVVLLHVITEGEQHRFVARREQLRDLYLPYSVPEPDDRPVIRRHDEAYLAGKVATLRTAGVNVRPEVVFGVPPEAIIAAAGRCEASMIVMATHGRGSVGRWVAGSVAHEVIRGAPCPVLAIRGPAHKKPELRRILVPLDGSEHARDALPLAADLARKADATLVLLMVIGPLLGLDPALVLTPPEDQPRTVRERMFIELQRLSREYCDLPVITAVGEGYVAETICREAEGHEVDLIVMTANGHGGRRHLGLGSVADRVLHRTPLPALVITGHSAEPTTTGEWGGGVETPV